MSVFAPGMAADSLVMSVAVHRACASVMLLARCFFPRGSSSGP